MPRLVDLGRYLVDGRTSYSAADVIIHALPTAQVGG